MKLSSKPLIILLFVCSFAAAQQIKSNYQLPGKGLKQYDFLYAGVWDMRKPSAQSIFLVRRGKIVWQYSVPLRTATGAIQEFDDAILLSLFPDRQSTHFFI